MYFIVKTFFGQYYDSRFFDAFTCRLVRAVGA